MTVDLEFLEAQVEALKLQFIRLDGAMQVLQQLIERAKQIEEPTAK